MRHVPIAEFKDRLSEIVAAAESGEEIVVTRHGRNVARLGPPDRDVAAKRRAAFDALATFRAGLRARGVATTSRDEIREWINEGRR